MKLMEKLKNALFEEEYVEVEEKPKKEKKKKEKKFGKSKKKDIEQIKNKGRQRAQEDIEEEVKEKPIVKKVAVPKEKPTPIIPQEENLDDYDNFDDFKEDRNELKGNNNFKFQEILEDDFKYEPTRELPKIEPQYNNVGRVKPAPKKVKPQEEVPLYQGGKKEETFGFEKEYNSSHIYESKPPKSTFKPSPIISPIYGVLDKNYNQEEIVQKKEIKLPTFKSEHLDIDEVRNRAYGVPTSTDMDMFEMDEEEYEDDNIHADDNNDLLDLTDNNEKPSVSKVTVGDAEEYFEDLGLEYNNDYIDASKEKKTGRRVKDDKVYEEVQEETTLPEKEIDEDIEPTKTDDENLFDLIDSMYEKE